MKIIEAVKADGSIRMAVHMDEAKQVRDPDQPTPAAGTPDTRRMVPDPAFVMHIQWGADVPVAVIKRETKLLVQAELARAVLNKVAALDGAAL